jgi:putative iron-dependent peroxidase
MALHQPGILAPVPPVSRYLSFQLRAGVDPRPALARLTARRIDEGAVVGLGPALVAHLDRKVEALREFPALVGPGITVPSTPAALWTWLRGDDPGKLVHAGRTWRRDLEDGLALDAVVDSFFFDGGRDLTGYEDGTENPTGDKALAAAFVSGQGPGLDGSSFVAVQRWRHDLDVFEAMSQADQDHTIGRRHRDNEELEDAPESAHVKRTAQESFDPEAFVLRRSMPWAGEGGEGLVFVAFGRSLDAFEAQLRRMVGLDDGITDALFRFSRPLTGSYFWCPPLKDGRLDLSAVGL